MGLRLVVGLNSCLGWTRTGSQVVYRLMCKFLATMKRSWYEGAGRALILKYIHAQGGPLWNDARYVREHEAYDAVCAHLYRFLMGAGP